jgi:hypothetical protein
MKYIVIKEQSIELLSKEVQKKIDVGWIPQGGVWGSSNYIFFTQAMILKSQ